MLSTPLLLVAESGSPSTWTAITVGKDQTVNFSTMTDSDDDEPTVSMAEDDALARLNEERAVVLRIRTVTGD